MIYVSSYVYGTPEYLPIDENHPVKAFNPYAQSKLLSEELCKGYNRDFDIPVTIFRPFNIYGPGQNPVFLIPSIIAQAKTGKIKLEDPRPRRDFIYIDDVVNAYSKAIDTNFKKVEIFNLGSGISTSIHELTTIIQNKISDNISVEFSGVERKNEVLDTIANIDKAKALLYWIPRCSLQHGIEEMLTF
jgi:UDP-glucose 4-epimerase